MAARHLHSHPLLWHGWAARWLGKLSPFLLCSVLVLTSLTRRALKIGGVEVARERWDEAENQPDDDDETVPMAVDSSPPRPARNVLPDWTRGPLPSGAPPANPSQVQQSPMVVVSSPQTAVGA